MLVSAEISPFVIAVPDTVLDDLRQRLNNTRWPDAELVDDWSQGIPARLPQGSLRVLGTNLRLARPRSPLIPP